MSMYKIVWFDSEIENAPDRSFFTEQECIEDAYADWDDIETSNTIGATIVSAYKKINGKWEYVNL